MLDEAIENFRRGVMAGRVAQGYTVVGSPRGEAKVFAEQALQLIFCESNPKPCGTCRSCRQVREHTHPDILWVEPEKKSRAISIEQIRDLQRLIFQTSFAGSWKACVMTAADRMGDPAANAFLKTLEEPPPKSLFFLLTDSPQSLLPTIVSRCQRVAVSNDQIEFPEEWQEAISAILADSSGNSPVAAFSRADRMKQLFDAMKEKAKADESEALEASGQDIDDETLDARISARYREMRTGLVQYLFRWYRDILMVVCEVDETFIHNRRNLDVLRRKANAISYRQALRNVETIEAMNRQFEGNIPELSVLGLAFCGLT